MDYYQEINSLLSNESLPHRFIVSYACACAKSVVNDIKDKDLKQKSLHCIDLAERFSKGEEIKSEELKSAAYAATHSATHSAYSAASRSAAYSATSAAYVAAHAAYVATHSANAYSSNDYNKAIKSYYELLIKMIDENLSEVEKALILPKDWRK